MNRPVTLSEAKGLAHGQGARSFGTAAPQDDNGLSRRQLLQLAIAGGAGALLAACGTAAAPASPGAAPASGSAGSAAAKPAAGGPYPTYIPPANGPKPDFQDPDPRYDLGFNNYPANPVKSWTKDPPGTAARVDILNQAYFPTFTPLDSNPTWKEVNKQLNADVRITAIAGADYAARLATITAGNDLPDILHLRYDKAANVPDFLKAKAADLTPYLGGDAAKTYPNLAAIPTYAWKNSVCAVDGKLYMIPIQRSLPGQPAGQGMLFKNVDIWDKALGANYQPKNSDDLKKALQAVNHPRSNQYALGTGIPTWNLGMSVFAQIFRAPNNWKLDAGKLVKDWETDEFKAAIGYMRDLWTAGVYHPNSLTNGPGRAELATAKIAVAYDGLGPNLWGDMQRQGALAKPPQKGDLIVPFANDGGKAITYIGTGYVGMTVLKQGSPDRIKELLRILDWLASPFGSQEDVLLSYGLKGQDYTLDANNNPVATKDGRNNAGNVPWAYIAQHPQVNYLADVPGFTKQLWDAEHLTMPIAVDDPTNGFVSNTYYGKGAAANLAALDGLRQIVANQVPLTNFDQVVKTWQSQAGDQIRKEYMDAINAAK